ncbi:hypothetical protein D3C85_1239840 [compost metagenome]
MVFQHPGETVVANQVLIAYSQDPQTLSGGDEGPLRQGDPSIAGERSHVQPFISTILNQVTKLRFWQVVRFNRFDRQFQFVGFLRLIAKCRGVPDGHGFTDTGTND